LNVCDNKLKEIINKETMDLFIELTNNPEEPNEKIKLAHERYKNYLNGK